MVHEVTRYLGHAGVATTSTDEAGSYEATSEIRVE
jgi:hypothetical protein